MNNWIKAVRKALIDKEISRQTLAEEVGIAKKTLDNYLCGAYKPTKVAIYAINRALGIEVDYDDE